MDQNVPDFSTIPMPPYKYFQKYDGDRVSSFPTPPPTPLKNETYPMFGVIYCNSSDINPPLQSKKVVDIPPSKLGLKSEVHKLHHSILVNFLDIITILTDSPSSDERIEKIQDLETLFSNISNLINEYRPHQAREYIVEMLRQQATQRSEVLEMLGSITEDIKTQMCGIVETARVSDVPIPPPMSPLRPKSVSTCRKNDPEEEDVLAFITSVMTRN